MAFKTKAALSFIPLVWLASCAGLVHHKNEEALAHVKSVAIVGFVVEEPSPTKIGLNLNSGDTHAGSGVGGGFKRHPAADKMFAELNFHFGEHLHWKVLAASKMKVNSGYEKAYRATMTGFHNRLPPGRGRNRYLAQGVMDDQASRLLDTAGRAELIRALKVDAIVFASINVLINGTSVMGIGSSHPQARLSFQVFREGQPRDDWFEGDIAGDESQENVGMFFGAEELNRLAEISARTAFLKIGQKN